MNLNDASSRMPDVTHTPSQSTPFKEPTSDNHLLGGFTWRHPRTDFERPVVIINAATSLRCRYYSRFADYLYTNGLDVITYDYRGIGESRSGSPFDALSEREIQIALMIVGCQKVQSISDRKSVV